MKPHDERLLVSPFVVNSEEYNENQDVAPLQSALQHLVTNVSFDALGSKRVVEASHNVMDAAEHERLVNHQAVFQMITATDIPKPPRSDASSDGEQSVSTCRSMRTPTPYRKKQQITT